MHVQQENHFIVAKFFTSMYSIYVLTEQNIIKLNFCSLTEYANVPIYFFTAKHPRIWISNDSNVIILVSGLLDVPHLGWSLDRFKVMGGSFQCMPSHGPHIMY